MKIKVIHHTPRVYEVYNDDESVCYGVVGTVDSLIRYNYLTYSSVDPNRFHFLPNCSNNNLDMLSLSCFAKDLESSLSYVREYDNNLKMKKRQEDNMFKKYKIFPNLNGLGWLVYKIDTEYVGDNKSSTTRDRKSVV